ncbi:p-hydroxybenzoic acid efflux pump subunit AaeA [Komagataeibacter europaeus]|uniref:ABC transporter/major facilitator superfamily multidrug resistance transporter HlyD/EmrA/FusE n=2 Tax=Komagataeibacter europaeus TaxID=33995 RepID=A0A0D6Q1Y3_KOMEU|nr:HlyD family secretion protein [Komagataeibacter europaeus]ARW17180.1 p-hydroxybenzoic acid efflux pump subunit AaeA [Komagataeibacter europaeus]KON64221.1 p-hydroxybenzoic acid efflux pump subunit AaeA [Komagataeibacter europaeus]GAN97298.1 ABC transporter/major facilitator superfamily multidrug resistance transporter HlyD/EmrA/FusE [Komagataeibacter europaeus NBRC 3261]GBQ45302.1 major facilitator superfamily multidrug resistance transporter HlyD/EmrA/FusE [Komagataeibacter europaeus LMG 18
MFAYANRLVRLAVTATILFVAAIVAIVLWDYYTASPWTRNGQVRAQVANIAPRISGQINEVRVHDNQFVHKGDVLYVIDPFDFRVKLDIADAAVNERRADLEFKTSQYERRQKISGVAVSGEEKQQFEAVAQQAEAQYAAALADLKQARINLERTEVRSSINGYVTNLTMRAGDYANAGQVNIQIIDADSYWVDGYFEETKIHSIKVGEPVRLDLMGFHEPLFGHVESITRGIASNNAATSIQGLPAVDPVYTWVRLAQRIPVRVKIDSIPPDLVLAAGMTATVTVVSEAGNRRHMSVRDALRHVGDDMQHLAGHR